MNDDAATSHPVLDALRARLASGSLAGARTDEWRIILSIEGGGNRGAISGGMALELRERGWLSAFDGVYGASAGSLSAAWILSSEPAPGIEAWADPEAIGRYTHPGNLLRGRPVVDLRGLTDEFYERTLRLDVESILVNPVSLHPLATDLETGLSVDLAPAIRDRRSFYGALRAGACLPLLAGRPVEIDGRRYVDGGLAESVPSSTPIAAGATHILILRSRKVGELPVTAGFARRVTAMWLGRRSKAARAVFLARDDRVAALDEELARREAEPSSRPAVLSVRPAVSTPRVGRLERDPLITSAGLAAGRAAIAALIEGR